MAAMTRSIEPCFLIIFWWWLWHCCGLRVFTFLLIITFTRRFFFTLIDSSNSPGWLIKNYRYRRFYYILQQQLVYFCRFFRPCPRLFSQCWYSGGIAFPSFYFNNFYYIFTFFDGSSSEWVGRAFPRVQSWLILGQRWGGGRWRKGESQCGKLCGRGLYGWQAWSKAQGGGGGQVRKGHWYKLTQSISFRKQSDFCYFWAVCCVLWEGGLQEISTPSCLIIFFITYLQLQLVDFSSQQIFISLHLFAIFYGLKPTTVLHWGWLRAVRSYTYKSCTVWAGSKEIFYNRYLFQTKCFIFMKKQAYLMCSYHTFTPLVQIAGMVDQSTGKNLKTF